ncbi:unnamed protein product, partial [Amaranthus hypochondriacus]
MAVEACMNPKMVADDSDDEKPIVFRRKSNQISSELKNSSSSVIPAKHSLKPVSDVRNTNDRNSSTLKGKMDSMSKPSSSKPTLGAQKSAPPLLKPIKSPSSSTRPSPSPPSSARPSPSPPPSKAPPVKPPSNNGSYSANHQSRKEIHVKEQKRATNVVKEGNSVKHIKEEYDDSDDDKPISARYSVGQRKGNSDAANVVVKSLNSDSDDDKPIGTRMDKGTVVAGGTQKLKAVSVKPPNDSDDEKPLSSKLMKNNSGTPSRKYDDSDEDKPLASKLQQNGSIKKENQSKKVLGSSVKRSSESSVGQSSMKKVKLSEASTSSKAKQTAAKSGVKDDDGHISIGQRNKAASSSKSVPPKKVAKFDSSKLRPNKKSKKIMKESKFSKSSKELPNSGDGQKWTTLVHNGVIFPPQYQPHGVKMLYNGKPVELTPEQEEVATMYAVMLETDYVKKEKFNENFFGDWRKILGKNHVIQDFSKCDFKPIYEWHLREKEKKKQMSAE